MDSLTIRQLALEADNGSLAALTQLVDICLAPNPLGFTRAHAYKFCVMAAFLGDAAAHQRAAELFGGIPETVEAAVMDEIEEWIERKLDDPVDDSVTG